MFLYITPSFTSKRKECISSDFHSDDIIVRLAFSCFRLLSLLLFCYADSSYNWKICVMYSLSKIYVYWLGVRRWSLTSFIFYRFLDRLVRTLEEKKHHEVKLKDGLKDLSAKRMELQNSLSSSWPKQVSTVCFWCHASIVRFNSH